MLLFSICLYVTDLQGKGERTLSISVIQHLYSGGACYESY